MVSPRFSGDVDCEVVDGRMYGFGTGRIHFMVPLGLLESGLATEITAVGEDCIFVVKTPDTSWDDVEARLLELTQLHMYPLNGTTVRLRDVDGAERLAAVSATS